jgi:hypothetical protein
MLLARRDTQDKTHLRPSRTYTADLTPLLPWTLQLLSLARRGQNGSWRVLLKNLEKM